MANINRSHLYSAAAMSMSAFFLLAGYELARSSSNSLFVNTYGADALPIAMAITPLTLIFWLWIYNAILSKLGPRKTLMYSTLGAGAILFLGYLGLAFDIKFAGYFLFLFKECYVVLLIEQYWSFLDSTLKEDEAKVLNGPIAGWSSVGAILGGLAVGALAKPLGTETMLIFSAVLALPGAFMSDIPYRLCGEPKSEEKKSTDTTLGLGELFSNKTLLSILFLILITQMLSAVLVINFQSTLDEYFSSIDEQTAYSGNFFAMLNAASAFMQFAIAPLLLKKMRVATVHVLIPVIHACTAVLMLTSYSIYTVSIAFFIFKSIDYSIFRAAKEILYIPLSFNARYRAKEFIDVFGYRFGKGGASLVFAGVQKIALIGHGAYAIIALMCSVAWAGVALGLTSKKQPAPELNQTSTT